jgi:ribulose-5-phosphate 4-epimerase/fuculose-1-phosphate aldolase
VKSSVPEWIGRVRLAAACRLMARLGWEEPLITQITLRVPGSHGAAMLGPAFGVPFRGEVGVE